MRGSFVGLATLDVIHYVSEFPRPDEKITADDRWIGAGGPAANAAIAFAALGGRAELITALGRSTSAQMARADLEANGVAVQDVSGGEGELAISSIVVDGRGRRTVVSVNAAGFAAPMDPARLSDDADVVLADGHHAAVALSVLDQARERGVPTVLDAGSAKPRTDELLSRIEYAIASSAFGRGRAAGEVARELFRAPTRFAAVSAGAGPVVGIAESGPFTIEVPAVRAVDTLGAGDVLHGAFAYHLCTSEPLEALERAVALASESCGRRGPRLRASA